MVVMVLAVFLSLAVFMAVVFAALTMLSFWYVVMPAHILLVIIS